MNPFLSHLHRGLEKGGFETDDVLAALLPLFRQASEAHERGHVLPVGLIALLTQSAQGGFLLPHDSFVLPQRHIEPVEKLLLARSTALEVIGESRQIEDVGENEHARERLDVLVAGDQVQRPAYLTGYQCWEQCLGHHDPVTDVFTLGLLLASLACGIDFTELESVQRFADARGNVFTLNARIHPVLARVVVQMTELDRHKRVQDLKQVVHTLENYRDQPIDLTLPSLKGHAPSERRRVIQEHLRDRLFEISRRNRLIYFKPTLQTLNLTVASVPLVLDVRNIRADQLFIWHDPLSKDLSSGSAISLGKYLRIEDAPYIPGVLDKIISDARRDRAEYGFAQLRLVLCFLRWHNLKEEPNERIHSPLLLQPVELAKRKGVRDAYVLTPTSTEAEVNPALRHHLRTLYGIALPEVVDLQETSMESFHATLQQQIQASEPGVTLDFVGKPRIELIHAKARQRLDQWKKRQRTFSVSPTSRPISHSYDRDDYRPKGLQLFIEHVRPKPLPLSDVLGAPPRPRQPGWVSDADGSPSPESHSTPEPVPTPSASQTAPRVQEADREMYTLRDADSGNRYHWAFDLCSMTLGNFHYRKMTLVRDYGRLSEISDDTSAFDSIFSVEPKPAETAPANTLPLRDQFPVIACDSAQAAAVARSRQGQSFIIQGPPGTGKSQTITNLIADYVARGKRVLFVCEKRAAIDVVFHRLRQQGLDELCCLIHDSQADKKEFIQNLKQTYEQWLAQAPDEQAERQRQSALIAIEHDLAALAEFSESMVATHEAAGLTTRRLLHRHVDTKAARPPIGVEDEERLPSYAVWLSHGALVQRLQHVFETVRKPDVFAQHPFRHLARDIILHPRPMETLRALLEELEPLFDALESRLELSGVPEDLWKTVSDAAAILDYARRVLPLAEQSQLALLDPRSDASKEFSRELDELSVSEKSVATARAAIQHWREPLGPADTVNALDTARRLERSLLRFVQPAYWRLRKTIRSRYDFGQHAVEPSLVRVLEELARTHEAEQKHASLLASFGSRYGKMPAPELNALLAQTRGTQSSLPPAPAALRKLVVGNPGGADLVRQLAELSDDFSRLETLLRQSFWEYRLLPFADLRRAITDVRSELRTLPDFLPILTELMDAPASLNYALRHSPVPLHQFEAAIAAKTVSLLVRTEHVLSRFDGRTLEAHRARLQENHRKWLKSNSATLRNQVRRQFREHVSLSNLPASQLDEQQKAFKKTYSAGRRELEHEFGKTMRYKSIRDLAAGPSGIVIRDLKPIWLMSPLSVSDTLPLDPEFFDVVIFDEASQIPVEEAVPAVYRARQTIVVGDEMQLPPTSFFSASRSEDGLDESDEADRVEMDLEADSFLAQASRNLPSTLLAWHYRSRYENLISFSNAAFYSGNLLTIPDRQLSRTDLQALRIKSADEAPAHAEDVLNRSISFHFLENGLYEARRNTPEAQYIAHLVRELLRRETKLSIGIVAFSEAQQSEVERALDSLANEDKAFAARLEAEINREEDDQFLGLFIKNLENVQGDERDIIILSICYGYDRQKKMLMNFGPINQRGGEKRLNVIFSRARHHMAVVSSIRDSDITNDYNDGANALRNFLKYAESLSAGDVAGARSVLENLNPLSRKALAPLTSRDAVIEQVAAALRKRGHEVDLQVGQSRFRCDLGVRSSQAPQYALGILVDTDAHYANADLVDRYLTRPGVLEGFGWKVLLVLTKDWAADEERVLERIERALRGEAEDNAELPDPEAKPLQSSQPLTRPEPAASLTHVSPVIDSKPSRGQVTGASSEPMMSNSTRAISSRRYFEFAEERSSKFWEVTVSGNTLSVRFGRIGTAGQTQEKTFATETEAQKAAEQLASSKLKKGYKELSR
jgi:predicted DNA-binding WGR domain protein/very-short-patch-repair endonuclease